MPTLSYNVAANGPRLRLFAVMLVVTCALCSPAEAHADTERLLEAVSRSNIRAHVRSLANQPRYTNAQLAVSATYITDVLQSYGYAVTREAVNSTSDDRRSVNLVAEVKGAKSTDEIVIVGAHYDTIATSPGADDNASGVAGLLEVARLLARRQPARTVRFVAFTFEESRFEGSIKHTRNVLRAQERIVAMISLEMIGYTCDTPGCQFEFIDIPDCIEIEPDGMEVGTGIAVVSNTASVALSDAVTAARDTYLPTFEIYTGTVAGTGGCFVDTRRSDHYPFWKHGFPALMLTDTANFRNPHYHDPSDTAATIDYDFAAQVTRLVLATVLQLAESPHTADPVENAVGLRQTRSQDVQHSTQRFRRAPQKLVAD